jgi:hypothetical protein
MPVKIYREELVEHNDQLVFECETWGELGLMPRRADVVMAIFGTFERTEERTLLYSNVVCEQDGASDNEILHSYDSMYLDDLARLRTGQVEVVE